MARSQTYSLTIDGATVRLVPDNSGSYREARALVPEGRSIPVDACRIVCDRRIHDVSMDIHGWSASGALVSVFERSPVVP